MFGRNTRFSKFFRIKISNGHSGILSSGWASGSKSLVDWSKTFLLLLMFRWRAICSKRRRKRSARMQMWWGWQRRRKNWPVKMQTLVFNCMLWKEICDKSVRRMQQIRRARSRSNRPYMRYHYITSTQVSHLWGITSHHIISISMLRSFYLNWPIFSITHGRDIRGLKYAYFKPLINISTLVLLSFQIILYFNQNFSILIKISIFQSIFLYFNQYFYISTNIFQPKVQQLAAKLESRKESLETTNHELVLAKEALSMDHSRLKKESEIEVSHVYTLVVS